MIKKLLLLQDKIKSANGFKTIMIAVLIVTMLVSVIFPVGILYAEESNKRVINVGYVRNDGFFDDNTQIDSEKVSGYIVSYLRELSKYTDWSYRYIAYDEYDSLLKDVDNGVIDLVGGIQVTDDIAQRYYISNRDMATTYVSLITREDSEILYEDYKAFDNIKIGYIGISAYLEELKNYMQVNEFDATLISYAHMDDLHAALQNGDIDMMMLGLTGLKSGEKIVAKIIPYGFYFITGMNNADIMNEVNKAQIKIGINQPDFQNELVKEYFGDAEMEPFTKSELDYIKECPVLKVGCVANELPLSYYDEKSGKVIGISPDIISKIADISGLRIELVALPDSGVDYNYLRDNGIHIVTNVRNSSANKSLAGLSLTLPYIKSQDFMVCKDGFEFSRDKQLKLAVCTDSNTYMSMLENIYPEFEIIKYPSFRACFEAVSDGNADATLQNQYVVDRYLAEWEFDQLVIVPGAELDNDLCMSIVTNQTRVGSSDEYLSDGRLISILNKSITQLSDKDKEKIIVSYTTATQYQPSFGDMLVKYRAPFVIVITLLAVCITFMVVYIHYRKYMIIQLQHRNNQLADAIMQAEHASSVKSNFLARISHELRTPMNAILGITVLARTTAGDEKKTNENLDKIEVSSKVLLDIIDDVIDMAAIENDKVEFISGQFDIKDIIKEINEVYIPLCRDKKISYVSKVSAMNTTKLIGDRVRVKQIINNLLSNAYKFTDEGGNISLSVSGEKIEKGKLFAVIKITDDGCGISDDMQQRLFKPFEQEDVSTALEHGGSGLGLPITKNLVEMMQGSIDVLSHKNKGTTFTISIPFKIDENIDSIDVNPDKNDDNNADSNNADSNNVDGNNADDNKKIKYDFKGKKILVVDDNEINLEIAEELLRMVNFDVMSAKNGKEAYDIFTASEAGTFSAILMDIQMPVLNGIEATKLIRKSDHADSSTIPIIAMTANAFAGDVTASLTAGMNEHMTKPIDTKVLFDTLYQFVGK